MIPVYTCKLKIVLRNLTVPQMQSFAVFLPYGVAAIMEQ